MRAVGAQVVCRAPRNGLSGILVGEAAGRRAETRHELSLPLIRLDSIRKGQAVVHDHETQSDLKGDRKSHQEPARARPTSIGRQTRNPWKQRRDSAEFRDPDRQQWKRHVIAVEDRARAPAAGRTDLDEEHRQQCASEQDNADARRPFVACERRFRAIFVPLHLECQHDRDQEQHHEQRRGKKPRFIGEKVQRQQRHLYVEEKDGVPDQIAVDQSGQVESRPSHVDGAADEYACGRNERETRQDGGAPHRGSPVVRDRDRRGDKDEKEDDGNHGLRGNEDRHACERQ